MAITQKTRFEIFKRDRFTCQYCGRRAPLVPLQVDHIIARHNEGTDDRLNLITSCFDCNSGKRARELGEVQPYRHYRDHPIIAEIMDADEDELEKLICALKCFESMMLCVFPIDIYDLVIKLLDRIHEEVPIRKEMDENEWTTRNRVNWKNGH